MQYFDSSSDGSVVRCKQVRHPKRDLSAVRNGAGLRLVEGEVHEGSGGPARGGVAAAGPGIITLVVVATKRGPSRVVKRHS